MIPQVGGRRSHRRKIPIACCAWLFFTTISFGTAWTTTRSMSRSTRLRQRNALIPTEILSLPSTKKPRILRQTSTHSHKDPYMDPNEARLLLQSWIDHSHADYHNFSKDQANGIRASLLEWYAGNRRKLPWRGDPPPFDGSTSGINSTKKKGQKERGQPSIKSFFGSTPSATHASIPVTGYGVWVSEIMLQQTRVEAVIPFWIKWMKSFPTVYELAAATEDEVNAHWAGLGFYRRARYLHQGAKYVVQELDGELPQTPEELSKIAGIGPYTAAAIASIAFGVCVPVVDGNVCRVLSRLTGIANHIKHPILKDKLGWKLAKQIVEAGDGSLPGSVNQALMELGATYCAPAGSGIDERDPLKDYYLSTKLGVAYRSVLSHGMENLVHVKETTEACCELCDPDGRLLILEAFRERIDPHQTKVEEAAMVGHSAFPTDPPKTDKREEDLAMVVLSTRVYDESLRYLMVKRPKNGLLAGQWEFPNVCVQIRPKAKKASKKASKDASVPKLPTRKERDTALTRLLLDEIFMDHPNKDMATAISDGAYKDSKRKCEPPLEHIFSHVKHYMWVETGYLGPDILQLKTEDELSWKSPSGREIRWMNATDMKEVGITSGVKKVLQSVEKQSATKNSKKKGN